MALTAAQIGAHTSIRFVANGTYEGGENFFVDTFDDHGVGGGDAQWRQW